MAEYFIKHRDVTVAAIELMDDGKIGEVRFAGSGHAPYLGLEDAHLLRQWWEMRAMPSERPERKDTILKAGVDNANMLLARNLGLGLTDSYWICPASCQHRCVKGSGKLKIHQHGADIRQWK